MFLYFRKGKNAAQTAKKIYIVYRDSAVAERQFGNDSLASEMAILIWKTENVPAVVNDDHLNTD